MRSNTDCWSNQQLNDRIEELEDIFEAVEKWIQGIHFKFPLIGDTCHLDKYELLALEKLLEDKKDD